MADKLETLLMHYTGQEFKKALERYLIYLSVPVIFDVQLAATIWWRFNPFYINGNDTASLPYYIVPDVMNHEAIEVYHLDFFKLEDNVRASWKEKFNCLEETEKKKLTDFLFEYAFHLPSNNQLNCIFRDNLILSAAEAQNSNKLRTLLENSLGKTFSTRDRDADSSVGIFKYAKSRNVRKKYWDNILGMIAAHIVENKNLSALSFRQLEELYEYAKEKRTTNEFWKDIESELKGLLEEIEKNKLWLSVLEVDRDITHKGIRYINLRIKPYSETQVDTYFDSYKTYVEFFNNERIEELLYTIHRGLRADGYTAVINLRFGQKTFTQKLSHVNLAETAFFSTNYEINDLPIPGHEPKEVHLYLIGEYEKARVNIDNQEFLKQAKKNIYNVTVDGASPEQKFFFTFPHKEKLKENDLENIPSEIHTSPKEIAAELQQWSEQSDRSIRRWLKNVDQFIEARKDHLFVLSIGATGSGKSSLLTSISYNQQVNLDKTRINNTLIGDYLRRFQEKGELPEETPPFRDRQRFDLLFADLIEEYNASKITFIELSGEEFEDLDRGFTNVLNKIRNKKHSVFDKNLTNNQKNELSIFVNSLLERSPNIALLLTASYDYAIVEDELLNTFLSYIKENKMMDNIAAIALIPTMWDKNEDNISLKDFIHKYLLQTRNQIEENFSINAHIQHEFFTFTIGVLDKNDKVLRSDETAANKLYNWLKKQYKRINHEYT